MKLLNKALICSVMMSVAFIAGCGNGYEAPKPSPLVAFTPAVKVHTNWKHHVTNGAGKETLKLTPAITASRIFVGDNKGSVVALDRTSGKTLWHVKTAADITSGVSVGSDLLFVGTGGGKVLALRQTDGKEQWQVKMVNEVLATPLYTQNLVVAKTESGQLSAFAAANGKRWWNYIAEGPALVLRGGSAPKAAGNLVVAGFASGELVAFDADSGEIAWRQLIAEPQGSFAVERMIDITADPIVADGRIYVATYQGKLAAVNVRTGSIIWQHNISTYSGLAIDDENVYVSDTNDTVSAFARDSGELKWRQKSLAYRTITAPAVAGSYVLVGDAVGYVHWMAKADGHFVARNKVDSNGIIAAPVVVDGNVYVVGKSGVLASLSI